jgi:hypothetical protein
LRLFPAPSCCSLRGEDSCTILREACLIVRRREADGSGLPSEAAGNPAGAGLPRPSAAPQRSSVRLAQEALDAIALHG